MRAAMLQELAHELYGPLLALEASMPTPLRRRAANGLLALSVGCGGVAALSSSGLVALPYGVALMSGGVAAIAAGLWMMAMGLGAWRNWYYYWDEDDHSPPPLTFEVAHLLSRTPLYDAVAGLGRSFVGGALLARLGIRGEEVAAFLTNPERDRVPLAAIEVPSSSEGVVRLGEYFNALYDADRSFRMWLSQCHVQEGDYREAVVLLTDMWRERKHARRWWNPQRWYAMRPLGAALSYRPLSQLPIDLRPLLALPLARWAPVMTAHPTLASLAHTLAEQRSVVLVGSIADEGEALAAGLAYGLAHGRIPVLREQEVVRLDWERWIATAREGRTSLERGLTELFSALADAGNIIVVVPQFESLLEAGKSLGVDLVHLVTPFLEGGQPLFVFCVGRLGFEQLIRPDGRLLRAATTIEVHTGHREILSLLWRAALPLERRFQVPLTIPALRLIAETVSRYVPAGRRVEEGVALISRTLRRARRMKQKVASRELAANVASEAYHVPLGEPSPAERERLLNLETTLAEEVVGQEEALREVARALRRSRAGVRQRNRPVGVFLFLGPTGVGKTQTAKALARVLFGDPSAVVRFDMASLRGGDAIAQLLGDAKGEEPGMLTTSLRTQPYAVYLLDEFEKAPREVLNVFLPLFDEGIIRDGRGEVVYGRDAIFIATSNAASDLIWQYAERGDDPTAYKEHIINEIVREGIFSPELLNRFDAVVVYRPLSRRDIELIAQRMIRRVVERLQQEHGIIVHVQPATFARVLTEGYDPRFGARPMARAVARVVEDEVARRLLAGEVSPGGIVKV